MVAFVCQYYGPFKIEERKFSLHSARCCFGDEPMCSWELPVLFGVKFVFAQGNNTAEVGIEPPPLTLESETIPLGRCATLKGNGVVLNRRPGQQMNTITVKNRRVASAIFDFFFYVFSIFFRCFFILFRYFLSIKRPFYI